MRPWAHARKRRTGAEFNRRVASPAPRSPPAAQPVPARTHAAELPATDEEPVMATWGSLACRLKDMWPMTVSTVSIKPSTTAPSCKRHDTKEGDVNTGLAQHVHPTEAANAPTHKIKFMLTVNVPAKEDAQHLLSNVAGQALPSRRPDREERQSRRYPASQARRGPLRSPSPAELAECGHRLRLTPVTQTVSSKASTLKHRLTRPGPRSTLNSLGTLTGL